MMAQRAGMICSALVLCAMALPIHAQSDSEDLITPNFELSPAPPPASLLGVWAKGGKCAIRSGRLHVTAKTLKFSGRPPVKYRYIPDVPHLLQGSIEISGSHIVMVYDIEERILGDDTDSANPNHLYFPCHGPALIRLGQSSNGHDASPQPAWRRHDGNSP